MQTIVTPNGTAQNLMAVFEPRSRQDTPQSLIQSIMLLVADALKIAFQRKADANFIIAGTSSEWTTLDGDITGDPLPWPPVNGMQLTVNEPDGSGKYTFNHVALGTPSTTMADVFDSFAAYANASTKRDLATVLAWIFDRLDAEDEEFLCQVDQGAGKIYFSSSPDVPGVDEADNDVSLVLYLEPLLTTVEQAFE